MKNIIYLIIFFLGISLFYYNFLNKKEKIIIKNNSPKIEKKQTKKINIFQKFDLDNDESITKFIDPNISYNNKKYTPKNLIEVNHIFIYSNKENPEKLRKIAKDALVKLSIDFYKKFNIELKIVSWYRSYERQKEIEKSACENNLCAKAWHSEHQSWLAIDLWQALTIEEFKKHKEYNKYFEWMNKNAYKYWFINTYKKWKKIDWYSKEPWHWRYIWIELATYLQKNNLSFAEFYYKAKELNKQN